MSTTTISVLCYSALTHAKRCLAAVERSRGRFKLILTANGSRQAYDYFKSVHSPKRGDVVIFNETNEGFIKPNNHALSLCDTPYFLTLNDDTVVPPTFLELMESEFRKHPTAALVGPRGSAFGLTMKPFFNGVANGKKEFLIGACLMCRTDLVKQHGLFADWLPGHSYGEDIELSLRMRQLGYTIHEAPFRIFHAQHATAKHIPGIKEIARRNHDAVAEHYADFLAETGVNGAHRIEVVDEDVVGRLGAFRMNTWRKAEALVKQHKLKNFLETGCYYQPGANGNSTTILATFAHRNGGMLDSYEISPEHIAAAKAELTKAHLIHRVRFHLGDSVQGLASRADLIDFAYLDSFDCGLGPDFGPCQRHQLAELEATLPMLSRRSVVLLDDNLAEKGKTWLVEKRMKNKPFEHVANEYQSLYSTGNARRLTPHRFCVLTGHLPNYGELAAQTVYHNKAQYCLRHGYDLRVMRRTPPEFSLPGSHAGGFSWGRMDYMLRLVESRMYEWVWVVGCDTVITNMGVTLESLVENATPYLPQVALQLPIFAPKPVTIRMNPAAYKPDGRAHVVICGDRGSPVQADSFLVRGSPQGAAYLRDIMEHRKIYKRHIWVENQAMIDLRFKHAAITCLLPQHRMNSFEYRLFHHMGKWYHEGLDCYGNRGDWKPGDFLVHWPATALEKRLELCKQKLTEVVT